MSQKGYSQPMADGHHFLGRKTSAWGKIVYFRKTHKNNMRSFWQKISQEEVLREVGKSLRNFRLFRCSKHMERHIQQDSRWHFCIGIIYQSFGLVRQMKLYRDPLLKMLNKNLTWWWLWEGEDNPKLRSPDVRLSFQGSSNKTSKPKSLTSVAHDGPWNPWNQMPLLNLKHKRGNRNWSRTHLYCKKVIPKLPCSFWCWQIYLFYLKNRPLLSGFASGSSSRVPPCESTTILEVSQRQQKPTGF